MLCDTNGGMLPLGIAEVVTEVAARTGFRLGIHCQDDTGCAVANSVTAVQAGATHVQCTANGYGERTGNADLFAAVGNLVTKLGMPVLPDGALRELTRTSHALAEIANIAPDTHQAYVGTSAFAHKAGLHASAIKVDPELYNHLDPVDVGNGQRVLVTEMAGRASVELKGTELGLDLAGHPDAVVGRGGDGQGAGGRWLVVRGRRRLAGAADARRPRRSTRAAPFRLESYRVITEHRADGAVIAEATVRIVLDGQRLIATEEGNGPVNALDAALRAALTPFCPWLDEVELSDYKVRILNPGGVAPRHRRGDPGAGRVRRAGRERARAGPRSACTATWSRRRGWPWSTPWPTPPCAPAPANPSRSGNRPGGRHQDPGVPPRIAMTSRWG